MATKIVPVSNDPNYVQRVQLDGKDYLFYFQFNAREGRWYVDLNDTDSVPIASGIKIVSGFLLANGIVDPNKPPGDLICVDMQSQDASMQDAVDPGLLTLGSRHLLCYFEV